MGSGEWEWEMGNGKVTDGKLKMGGEKWEDSEVSGKRIVPEVPFDLTHNSKILIYFQGMKCMSPLRAPLKKKRFKSFPVP